MPRRNPRNLAPGLKPDSIDVAEATLRMIVLQAEQALWRRCHNEAFSVVLLDGEFVCHLGALDGMGWEFRGSGVTLRQALTNLLADIQTTSQEPPRAS